MATRAEVDSFYEFLIREEVVILDAPSEYDYTPGYYAIFFADPDGIKFELVYEPRIDKFTPNAL
jgi:glyoxylase I family protein